MELIERYVNEVGRRLPKDKRDDIREELRSALDDALEARVLGTPSESDVVAVLNEFGPPQAVAASYRGDRYLIGPELYPQFLTTLRVVVTILAALVVLGSAIPILTSVPGLETFAASLAGIVGGLVDSVITSVGIVVIVFALLERLDVRIGLPDKKKAWDPQDLPAVRDADVVGRFDSIAQIVFPAIVLILLNQFRDRIGIAISSEDERFAIGIVSERGGDLLLNDVFLDNLVWINASLLLPMALSVWLLWSGRWHFSTRLLKVAFDVFGLYVFHRLCQGAIGTEPQFLAAGIPGHVVGVFVRILELAPLAVAVVVLIDAGKHLYLGFKSSR